MTCFPASWLRFLACGLLAASGSVAALQAIGEGKSGCSIVSISADDLRPWEPKQLEISGTPVVVILGTNEDVQNLQMLSPHVFSAGDVEPTILSDGRAVFAVIPVSPYSRCRVEYVPRGTNSLQWDEKSWLGGFHSPCHSEVFDLLGRQIKPGVFSPTGFPKYIGNLPSPKLRMVSSTTLEITVR